MTKEELKEVIGKAKDYAINDWRTTKSTVHEKNAFLCMQMLTYI